MFINTSVFFTAALATIAAAAPTNLARDGVGGLGGGDVLGGDNCNANALCCDNYGSADQLQGLLGGLLGLNVDALTGNLGIACVPIEVIALIPDNSCNAQSVCCEGTTFSNLQLIGLNCLPLKLL
ncbi:hydrophobin-251 [Pisolithus tinctorius]|nr:hydrophobin-251 [Pisolithus tinctorius]